MEPVRGGKCLTFTEVGNSKEYLTENSVQKFMDQLKKMDFVKEVQSWIICAV
jgi:hypothetical protein